MGLYREDIGVIVRILENRTETIIMGPYRDNFLFIWVGPIRDIQIFSLDGFIRTLDTNIFERAPKANQVQVGGMRACDGKHARRGAETLCSLPKSFANQEQRRMSLMMRWRSLSIKRRAPGGLLFPLDVNLN